mgnify:CR=1 FL=1
MAEIPRIRGLSRQDSIRTAVPRAFMGGSAERGIVTNQAENLSKAIDNLVKIGAPLSAKLHEEFNEEQVKEGLFRVSKASDETIRKLRDGVTSGFLTGEESPAYVEGVNRGVLRVQSRVFGENALVDWRKSKEYNSEDPRAFSTWIQNYRAGFNQKFIDGLPPDLIAEEFLPRQNGVINQLQQRHQEKQARDYEYNAVVNMQQDMQGHVEAIFKDRKFVKLVTNYFYDNPSGSLQDLYDDPILGKDSLTEVTNALKSQSSQLSISSKEHNTLLQFSQTLVDNPLFEGTRIQEQANSFLEKYTFNDNFKITKEELKNDLSTYSQTLLASPLFMSHELFEYINEEPEVRYNNHGMNPKTTNQSMIDVIKTLSEDYEKPGVLRGLINSFQRGKNTEYANNAIESGTNTIISRINRRFTIDDRVLKQTKLLKERRLFDELSEELESLSKQPGDFDRLLPKTMVKYQQRAIKEGIKEVGSYIKSFIDNVGNTAGTPDNEFIKEVNDIWLENINNPDEALRKIEVYSLKAGVLFDKLPNAKFYKQIAKDTLNYKETGGLFSAEFRPILRMMADAVDDEGKFKLDENGIPFFADTVKDLKFTEKLQELKDWWTSTPKKPGESDTDFFRRVREWALKEVVNPAQRKEKEEQAKQNLEITLNNFDKEFDVDTLTAEFVPGSVGFFQKTQQKLADTVEDLTGFTGLQPDTLERLKRFYERGEASLKSEYPTFDSFIRFHIYPKIQKGSNE